MKDVAMVQGVGKAHKTLLGKSNAWTNVQAPLRRLPLANIFSMQARLSFLAAA